MQHTVAVAIMRLVQGGLISGVSFQISKYILHKNYQVNTEPNKVGVVSGYTH